MKQAAIALIILILMFLLMSFNDNQVRVYDCGMAEWHPDIPKEVKEECRKRRNDQSKKSIST